MANWTGKLISINNLSTTYLIHYLADQSGLLIFMLLAFPLLQVSCDM